jgi:putative two-component system response regulator
MERHTITGAALLAGSSSSVLAMAREIALCHHENWDGTGYPNGLAGKAIPEAARILSIADVYDALAHERVYRRALDEDEVLKIMSDENGRKFDPSLMAIFLTVLDQFRDIAQRHPDDNWGRSTDPPFQQRDVSPGRPIWSLGGQPFMNF